MQIPWYGISNFLRIAMSWSNATSWKPINSHRVLTNCYPLLEFFLKKISKIRYASPAEPRIYLRGSPIITERIPIVARDTSPINETMKKYMVAPPYGYLWSSGFLGQTNEEWFVDTSSSDHQCAILSLLCKFDYRLADLPSSLNSFHPNSIIVNTCLPKFLRCMVVKLVDTCLVTTHDDFLQIRMAGPMNIILRHRHHNKERPLRFLSGR